MLIFFKINKYLQLIHYLTFSLILKTLNKKVGICIRLFLNKYDT